MKLSSFVFSVFCLTGLMGCQNSPARFTESLSLPYSKWNIGEYSQIYDEKSVVTFNRSEESSYRGLVRLNWENQNLEVLDALGAQGRDLIVDKQELVYRLGGQIVSISGSHRRAFDMGAESIRGFHSFTHFHQVFFEGRAKESVSLCFDREGEILSHQILPQSIIKSFRDQKTNLIWVLTRTDEGLLLSEVEACSKNIQNSYVVDEEARTEHALIGLRPNSKLFVAFLSEVSGLLYYGEQPNEGRHFNLERVDGITGESYRGMDLFAFEEAEAQRPSFLYLDAWSLELRLARFRGDSWKSQLIPIKGSVGFFNLVLKVEPGQIKALTNSFRTQHSKFEVSDDDLILYRWDLKNEELLPWSSKAPDKDPQ